MHDNDFTEEDFFDQVEAGERSRTPLNHPVPGVWMRCRLSKRNPKLPI